jgi:CPA2 family monovalent cation:H+ antiporter-2
VEDASLVRDLAILGWLAVITAVALSRLQLPVVAGFLVAGAVFGPDGAGLLTDTDEIREIADIGVVLLLFGIGLEFSLERLRYIWRSVAIGGAFQVGLTAAIVFVALLLIGDTVQRSLLFGFVIALSSTAVVLRALTVRGEIDAPHGRFTVGVLIFQDLSVVPLVLLVPVLAGEGGGAAVRAGGEALLTAALAIAMTIVAGRLVIPRLFRVIDAARSREVFLLAVLSIGLGTAWVMSELGLSLALGALLAGMVLAEAGYGERAVTSALPLRDVLLSVFFISLGMLFDPAALIEEPGAVIAIVVTLLLGKTVIAAIAATLMRYPPRAAWLAAVSLAQFGEFGFVLLALAEGDALITSDETRLVVSAGIVSMVISRIAMGLAPHLRAGEAALRPLERLMRTSAVDEAASELRALSGHIVLAGFGVAGRLLAHAANEASIPLIVLDVNAERVRDARESGAPVYYGDVTSEEALRHAGIDRARALVLLINDPDALRRAVAAAREQAPEVFIIARSRYVVERATLMRLGADLVVYEELEAGLEVATRVLRRFDVGPAELQAFVDRALMLSGHTELLGDLEAVLAEAEEDSATDGPAHLRRSDS